MSNKSLSVILKDVESKVDSAESPDALLKALENVQRYSGAFKFDNTIQYVATLFSLTSAFGIWYFSTENSLLLWGVIAGLVLFGLGTVYYAFHRARWPDRIADKAFEKDAYFDNGVIWKTPDLSWFQSRFYVFECGNYSKELTSACEFSEIPDVDYFSHHYVQKEERTVTSTDKDGRTTVSTKTDYHHYHRYGIVIPFISDFNGLIVKEYVPHYPSVRKYSFAPGSHEFNAELNGYGDSELQVSKFLRPSVVEKLTEYAKRYPNLCVEINNNYLCVSSGAKLLNYGQRKHGIEDVTLFIEELNGHTDFTQLQDLIELTSFLKRFI